MMLKLKTIGNASIFLNLKYKKFKDSSGKFYRGDKTVLILDKDNPPLNVTKESYNKFYKQHRDKLVPVNEVTGWRKKIDNLKISTKFGTSKPKWKSPKKNGQAYSTTLKTRGNVQMVTE